MPVGRGATASHYWRDQDLTGTTPLFPSPLPFEQTMMAQAPGLVPKMVRALSVPKLRPVSGQTAGPAESHR